MDFYIASILAWAATYAPRQFAFCKGQLIAIAQNQALFALLGSTYGGDARTTFNLPDLRGRATIGTGQGPGLPAYALGAKLGVPTKSLGLAQLPGHTHSATMAGGGGITGAINVTTASAETGDPTDAYLAAILQSSKASNAVYSTTRQGSATLASDALTLSGGGGSDIIVGDAGQSEPFSIMQPSTVINFIICMEGIFPPRN